MSSDTPGPLDKNPGVRPADIGEILRRIIRRTITECIKSDLPDPGKNYQLCLKQKFGINFAIHSFRKEFEKLDTEAILITEAENAFKSLNRELALKNVEVHWPALQQAVVNAYQPP